MTAKLKVITASYLTACLCSDRAMIGGGGGGRGRRGIILKKIKYTNNFV